MKIYKELQQKSEEWLKVRAGKLTASEFSDIGKADKSTQTEIKYAYKLAGQKYTGSVVPTFAYHAMQHGNEHEPAARNLYEVETGIEVQQVGFVEFNEWFGWSPDGLVYEGDKLVGAIEIKCPESLEAHVAVIIEQKVPDQYIDQLLSAMYGAKLEWIDFVSYHPSFLGLKNEIVIIRLRREDYVHELAQIEKRANRFISLLQFYHKILCA